MADKEVLKYFRVRNRFKSFNKTATATATPSSTPLPPPITVTKATIITATTATSIPKKTIETTTTTATTSSLLPTTSTATSSSTSSATSSSTSTSSKSTSSTSTSSTSTSFTSSTSTPTTTIRSRRRPTIREPDFVIKVYKYYRSCIAVEQYEPIKYLEWLELNEHVKWPSLINATNSEKPDDNVADEAEVEDILMDDDDDDDDISQEHNSTWINTLGILRKYGLNGIFIEEVIYSTELFPTKLLLGFDKPIKDGGFQSLKSDNLKIILESLGITLTAKSYKDLWLNITKFEWKLIKLNDVTDDLGVNLVTLENLPVPWLNDYLRIIFNITAPLDLSMKVVIANVGYFVSLDELLKEYDDDFLNQYLKIRFLWHLYKQEPQEFMPMECLLHIKHFIPLAFEWIFEQQHPELKEEIPKIHDMYDNIRRQFNITLYINKNNFDTTLLEYFVTKLESIQLKVGTFTKSVGNDFFYENRKFFSQLKLSPQEYYNNHLKMLKFNFDAIHFGLQTITPDSIYYDMEEYNSGLNSSPYFNKRLNTLNIPLSLLQPPIYHSEFTDVYKYSTLGFLLAQTLMYGFNLNDLALNEHSKLKQNFKCLGYLNSMEVDDKIATTGGIRLSYHTFFHSNANNLISNRKIFFLSFAQTFCAVRTAGDDLGRSHVNYALAQFTEFGKTFECAPDSHMNPHEKCYLWD